MGEIFDYGNGSVVGRCLRHVEFAWEEIDDVRGPFVSGMHNVDCAVSIVKWGRSNVLAMCSVIGLFGDVLFFLFIYYCFRSARCERSCVEVEISENLIVGG